jgi:SAM-dependent methyltransferase
MEAGPDLLEAIVAQLSASAGTWLAIGDRRTLLALQERSPGLAGLLLEPRSRRSAAAPRLLRGDPLRLPLGESSLEGIVALAALSRYPDAPALLAAWTRCLRPGGRLLIAEPLVRSATMRRLTRLLGGPRFARAPDEITGLLLNAGFGEIGQRLVEARGAGLITSARLLEL